MDAIWGSPMSTWAVASTSRMLPPLLPGGKELKIVAMPFTESWLLLTRCVLKIALNVDRLGSGEATDIIVVDVEPGI